MHIEQSRKYSEQAWKENPKLSPNSWRVVEGLTLSKFSLDLQGTKKDKVQPYLLAHGLNHVFINTTETADAPQELSTFKQSHPNHVVIAQSDSNNLLKTMDYANILLIDPMQETVTQRDLETLETAVKEGKLITYGVASYRYTLPKEHPLFLDLNQTIELAEKAAQVVYGRKKRSQLKVVAAPYSLFNLAALTEVNHQAKTFYDDEAVPLLEMVARRHLTFIAQESTLIPFKEGYLYAPAQPDVSYAQALKDLGKEEVKMMRLLSQDLQKAFPALSILVPDLLQKTDIFSFEKAWQEVRLTFSYLLPHLEEHMENFKAYTEKAQLLYKAATYELMCKQVEKLPLESLREKLSVEEKELSLKELMLQIAVSTPSVSLVVLNSASVQGAHSVIKLMEMPDIADIAGILS